MKSLLILFAAILLAAGTASAESPLQEPRFQPPTAEQMLRLYPKAAKKERLSGEAIIACVWNETGRLTCRVLSETPPDMGFGQATIKGFEAYGRALDVNAPSAPGQEKKFRFRWAMY
jgi:periplasmic protein TonB